ncbi:MAG: TlyA family RNA methyltransferase [Chloroflexi bacterium]|nr:TlyA family RNA methyltransferase [Chloroflexota bacterium]
MPKVSKLRLDQAVLARGLAETREQARGLVLAGRVRVDGHVVDKAGSPVRANAGIEVERGPQYVSRGGVKLAHALDQFGISVRDVVALDVGASTGGFTDCLLQRGAKRVYAVDAGRGQLHDRLRRDPRVVSMERVNAHHAFELPEKATVATVDVSFISLTKVLPNMLPHLARPAWIVCLVKPQFEAGRQQVGKGGVVRDPLVHGQVLATVTLWAIEQGLRIRGITPSPVVGDAGNREFLLALWAE